MFIKQRLVKLIDEIRRKRRIKDLFKFESSQSYRSHSGHV